MNLKLRYPLTIIMGLMASQAFAGGGVPDCWRAGPFAPGQYHIQVDADAVTKDDLLNTLNTVQRSSSLRTSFPRVEYRLSPNSTEKRPFVSFRSLALNAEYKDFATLQQEGKSFTAKEKQAVEDALQSIADLPAVQIQCIPVLHPRTPPR